jgi:hypothetical protein
MPREDMAAAPASLAALPSWWRDLPKDPRPGTDEEAFVLAAFTNLLNEDPESPLARKLRDDYSGYKSLVRMMDAVSKLKGELARRERAKISHGNK